MSERILISSINGKCAGECPQCNLPRGDWELKGSECKRCGYVFTSDPKTEEESAIKK
jgi:rubredoxin